MSTELAFAPGNQALQVLAQTGALAAPTGGGGNQALQRALSPRGNPFALSVVQALRPPRARTSVVAVQRHSSWEHRMLGDTDPRKLAMMGAAQDAFGVGMIVGNDDTGYQTIIRSHIQHALEEEIGRLEAFRTSDLFKDRQLDPPRPRAAATSPVPEAAPAPAQPDPEPDRIRLQALQLAMAFMNHRPQTTADGVVKAAAKFERWLRADGKTPPPQV